MATSLIDIGHLLLEVASSGHGQLRPQNEQKASSTIMKLTSLTAALGTALFLAGAPLLASAADQAPAAPIQINDVRIGQAFGSSTGFQPGLASVAFTNENSSPATEIVFALENQKGQLIDRFEDVGNYAQGVTVRHDFTDIELGYNQKVAVEKATFADGSVWENSDISYPNYPTVVGY
jgi:hypothetical protein